MNWTHSSDLVRLDIRFGVSYDADPHAIKRLAPEAAMTVTRVVKTPSPVCHIVGFGDSSVDFVLRFWIKDPTGGLTNARGNVYLALWDALKAANVEIPFPQRDVTIKNAADKTIGGQTAVEGGEPFDNPTDEPAEKPSDNLTDDPATAPGAATGTPAKVPRGG